MSNTVDLNKLRQMSRNNPAYVGTHNMMEYAIQELETARIEIARLEAECAAMKGSLKKIASASTGEDGCFYTNRENIHVARSTLSILQAGEKP